VGLGVALAPTPTFIQSWDAPYLSMGVLPLLTWALPLAAAIGVGAAALWPRRSVERAFAPALAIAMVAFSVARSDATIPTRAPFQGPQAHVARETLRKALERRSVVITTEDIGRPAENIEYYGGVPALYLTDLYRWRIPFRAVAYTLIYGDLRPYLLV